VVVVVVGFFLQAKPVAIKITTKATKMIEKNFLKGFLNIKL
jgi:hypothetical protein